MLLQMTTAPWLMLVAAQSCRPLQQPASVTCNRTYSTRRSPHLLRCETQPQVSLQQEDVVRHHPL